MVRVWEYDVPETSRAEFERTYGAAGDWVQLFSSSDGFRGTELFVSLSDPGRYLTVDRFTDEGAWRAFLTEHRDAYARLDAASKGLTTDEASSPAARSAEPSLHTGTCLRLWPESPD